MAQVTPGGTNGANGMKYIAELKTVLWEDDGKERI